MNLNEKAMKFVAATARSLRESEQSFSHTVPSPCMSVCQMDEASGLCQGCLRTIDEIRAWGNADDAFKRGVWCVIEARLARLTA
ncbi:DUF1289 domain-containing protein [Rhodoferax sp.]|uniref:DUF1289 domain-containing protein n=1 Tax=Rhodoferax sp. TaxID=50421 RepID=UPI00262B7113|nr:DUF1289 domain-containing protein [Rhodoferax sp.]MDD2925263.1 DUF1289 domain-containing protein [Rhodoferax sp.]